jgi:hypothetical protein
VSAVPINLPATRTSILFSKWQLAMSEFTEASKAKSEKDPVPQVISL